MISHIIPGTIEPPTSSRLSTTNVTDVLTVAASARGGITVVTGITIVNEDSSARLATVWWHDGTTAFRVFEGSIAANTTETEALKSPITLNAKETAKKIQAQAAVADKLTFTVFSMVVGQQ